MKQLVIFFLCLIAFTLATTETNSAQAETILNMFNSLLTPQSTETQNQAAPQEINQLENNFAQNSRFKERIPRGSKSKKNKNKKIKTKKGKKLRIRKRKVYKDPIAVLKEGWLKISSPMFRHAGKFPPITLPDGDEVQIRCNKNYFRINDAYNPLKKSKELPPSRLYFWFRLSGKNLYYSQSQNDLNVLGVLTINNMLNTGRVNDYNHQKNCFRIIDREQRKWKLCAETRKHKYAWICQFKTMLGYQKIKECAVAKGKKGKGGKGGNPAGPNGSEGDINKGPTIFTRKVTTPIILIPLPSKNCNEGWDYSNKGGDWNCECSEGKEQSPINLPPPDKAIQSPIKPIFSFNEVKAKSKERTVSGQFKSTKILTMKYQQNALRIHHQYFGKVVTLDGGLYTAEEIVFHTPSEHQIDGKRLDMEMQIIYYGKSSGDIAKQVVLSFLFKKKAGVYNKFIDDLDFFNLPNPSTKKKPLLNNLFIPKIFYHADQEGTPILKPFSFYTYQGSLTAPPCSERTIFYVAAQPIKLGTSAIQLFQEAIRIPDKIGPTGEIITSNLPNENNRTIQPLNGRAVFYYDHTKYECDTKKIEKKLGGGDPTSEKRRKRKTKGHYEKVLKRMSEYFYVSGPKPSGLPGAYVVSKKEAEGNGAEEF